MASVDTAIPPDVHDRGNVDNQITSEVVSGELNDITSDSGEVSGHKLKGRKRRRNEADWKCNARKRLRQAGKEYTDSKGNQQKARKCNSRKQCNGNCIFKCTEKIDSERQIVIFEHFWQLPDTEKSHFYAHTTTRSEKQRPRKNTAGRPRQFAIRYYLEDSCGELVRVCKSFYLSTLDISQRKISYFHSTKLEAGLPRASLKGKHIHVSEKLEQMKNEIRNHIKSIPRLASHYCRARTGKEYVEGNLNLTRLYHLYVEKCTQGRVQTASESMYRDIFNHEFNIEFQKPKSDRCDQCEAFKQNRTPGVEDTARHDKHIQSKNETRSERDNDRSVDAADTAVICFDLQNVIPLPRANISSFYYRRKLNVYNLTAHVAINSEKKGYCAVWNEGMCGRGANHIASALVAVLKKVVSEYKVKHIILWSDSCVPQNRNSVMTFALLDFLHNNPSVESIL